MRGVAKEVLFLNQRSWGILKSMNITPLAPYMGLYADIAEIIHSVNVTLFESGETHYEAQAFHVEGEGESLKIFGYAFPGECAAWNLDPDIQDDIKLYTLSQPVDGNLPYGYDTSPATLRAVDTLIKELRVLPLSTMIGRISVLVYGINGLSGTETIRIDFHDNDFTLSLIDISDVY